MSASERSETLESSQGDSESPLRAIVVDDSADDALLLARHLRRDAMDVDFVRVATADEFVASLDAGGWDVILADYSLPGFSGLDALHLMRERGVDLPFIIVSGSVSEALAVAVMKAGAHDFFAKNNLTRLSSAIRREVHEAHIRNDSREAVDRLRRIEERDRLIVESVKDHAIVMLDANGNVESWNRGAERVLGYREDEILRQPQSLFFTPEDREDRKPEAALARARAGERVDEEGWRLRKDGTRFWAESSLNVILDGTKLLGYSKIIRDISERKQLVDDLRQAVRSRDEFLSIASHELKTPLTSLQLQAQSLQRHVRARMSAVAEESQAFARVAAGLDVIVRQADRLTTLINHLLEVTRIASDRMVLVREPVDLADIVRGVVARSHDAIARSESVAHVTTEPAEGNWDRTRIDAVVTNLISNALRYGQSQPIHVTVARRGHWATLTVRDHGIGIPLEEQSRIFERFERAIPHRNYSGFGIGLWIVAQVVEAHGGTIAVASAPEGGGTTFTVELPTDIGANADPQGGCGSKSASPMSASPLFAADGGNEGEKREK